MTTTARLRRFEPAAHPTDAGSRPRSALVTPAAAEEDFARFGLRFLLLNPQDDSDAALLGAARIEAPGERTALGLVDADAVPAARADLAVPEGGIGHWWIRVRPDLRGRGIGGRLLELTCRHARLAGTRCLHADLRAADTRALHLMRRAGVPRTLAVDPTRRSTCLELLADRGCRANGRVQCLCAAALRPHPPHRAV